MTGALVQGTDDGTGRWMTYDELAALRGIMHAANTDSRIADLEQRLAAEQTKRVIAEQRAAALRHAMALMVQQLKAADTL